MEVVSLWYRSKNSQASQGTARLRIENEDHQVIGTAEIAIDLISSVRFRSRIRLDGLPIQSETSKFIFFVIELSTSDNQWIETARVPLDLSVSVVNP